MIKIKSKADKNGNSYQTIIDNDKKTIKCGYFLFAWGCDVILNNKKQVKELAEAFICDGYKKIEE